MSATIASQALVESCEWCEDKFIVQESPRPNHCSHDCYFQDKGDGALNQLASDHTICAACFRYIKTLSTPEQSWLEDKADRVRSAIDHGGELTDGPNGQLTLDATDCSNSRHTETDSIIGYQHPTPETDYLYGNSGKWICSCGNVETHHRDEILEALDIDETVSLLLKRLEDLYDKGAIQKAPTERFFYESFDPETRNWEYAVGKCLYKRDG